MNYFDTLKDEVRDYFKILSNDIPEFLYKYIELEELKRIGTISMNCGTDYSKLFNNKYFYSNLDHSVGVALIIWHFTHDKKQTIAGLFHDIATPAFKHCIDFMNGDSEKQESTEEKTTEIIKNSKNIMKYLIEDGVSLEDVCDYKLYPIADNSTPRLSADRFEYNFSGGLSFYRVWELDRIKEVYDNIIVCKNEDGIEELTFKDVDIAEKYVLTVAKLWPKWIEEKDRTLMQFFADICSSMSYKGYLSVDELYELSEKEIIDRIKNCDDEYIRTAFDNFVNTSKVYTSEKEVKDKYCVNIKSKIRYIDPLVSLNDGVKRISEVSTKAKKAIEKHKNYKFGMYTYFDFDFKPYKK